MLDPFSSQIPNFNLGHMDTFISVQTYYMNTQCAHKHPARFPSQWCYYYIITTTTNGMQSIKGAEKFCCSGDGGGGGDDNVSLNEVKTIC